MAQNLSTKKSNFLSRFTDANTAFLNAIKDLTDLKAEWDADAYATGASPAENNITDADVQAGFPYLTALQVNQLVGAYESIKTTVAANRGYLEAARP